MAAVHSWQHVTTVENDAPFARAVAAMQDQLRQLPRLLTIDERAVPGLASPQATSPGGAQEMSTAFVGGRSAGPLVTDGARTPLPVQLRGPI